MASIAILSVKASDAENAASAASAATSPNRLSVKTSDTDITASTSSPLRRSPSPFYFQMHTPTDRTPIIAGLKGRLKCLTDAFEIYEENRPTFAKSFKEFIGLNRDQMFVVREEDTLELLRKLKIPCGDNDIHILLQRFYDSKCFSRHAHQLEEGYLLLTLFNRIMYSSRNNNVVRSFNNQSESDIDYISKS